MVKSTKGTRMIAAPAAAAATVATALFLFVAVAYPGGATLWANTKPTAADSIGPHGYVIVTVTRDGKEVYRHEDHNLITNAGKDFIAAQIGSNSTGGNGANFIAVSSNSAAPVPTNTGLAGEIGTGGLNRQQGSYSHAPGTNTFTVTKTFTATASHANVQKAGLFTAASAGTMMAENIFTPVNLASNDQLTITWTITLS
ncbi:MAG: hypothetical protein C4292_01830 [Nitrososphaera sp.]